MSIITELNQLSQKSSKLSSDDCHFPTHKKSENSQPPQSNRGLLSLDSPITTTQADICPLGFRKGQGYDLTIDWISATSTKKLAPRQLNDLIYLFSRIPGNKLHLTGGGFGSGFAYYPVCYRSARGGVFAYRAPNYNTVRTVDIKEVQLGEFFDSPSLQITWESSFYPTLKSTNIPPFELIKAGVIKVHSKSNLYSIIVPYDWTVGATDYLDLEIIEEKLQINFNVKSNYIPEYKFGSNDVRWHHFENQLEIIPYENVSIDAAVNQYELKVEFSGEFLRELTLSQCLNILRTLKETGFELTRIDPRLRDWSRRFEPTDLFHYALNGHISQVNVFSAPRIDYEFQSDGSILMKSSTFYAGSPQSEKRNRAYCEREKHGCDSVAYETVLKDNKARSFMDDLLSLYRIDDTMQLVRKRILDAVFSVYAITKESRGKVQELIQNDKESKTTGKLITKNKLYNAKLYHPEWQQFIDDVYSYFSRGFTHKNLKPIKINGYRGGAKTNQLWKTNPVEAQKRAMNFHLRTSKSRYKLMQSMSPAQWEHFVKTEQSIGKYAVKKHCDYEYVAAVISHSRQHTKDYMTLRFLEDCYHHKYSLEKIENNLAKIESDFDSTNYNYTGVSFVSSDFNDSHNLGTSCQNIDMSDYYHVIDDCEDYIAIKEYLEDFRSGKIQPFDIGDCKNSYFKKE